MAARTIATAAMLLFIPIHAHAGSHEAHHIAADHTVDVCILEREYPQRVGYGQSLEALFDGHISVAGQDALGRPTAHRLLGLGVKWEVSR